MSDDFVIRVTGLRMAYGDREAVRGIDLDVRRGEIFCFLGPNGAGKTTTVEILEGYRDRTAGDVEVLGVDPARGDAAWRGNVGVVLQDCQPEWDLTAAETVEMYAGFHDDPLPVSDVLTLVGLAEQARVKNSRLSGGQQRRLDFALALVGDPELIFLDEPTTGFDPAARRAAWDVVAGLRALGKTIFLTTHYLEEAEVLADRIAVLAAGRIVAAGTPSTLGDRHHAATTIRVRFADRPPKLPQSLARRVDVDGTTLTMRTHDAVRDLHAMTAWLADHAGAVEIDVRQPSLEDTYLALVSEEVAP
jgi:ABC-2 type transport system ATP-binding protein